MESHKIQLKNPLEALQDYGQSVWLDYLRRSLITSGELQRLITEDGLMGVTSNPSIFEKAIVGSNDYKDLLESRHLHSGDPKTLFERLAIRDVQEAADLLRPIYSKTKKRDGYVSLAVSPHLARDTRRTLEEARRLWRAVGRQNAMIKVPATQEGIPAIEELISEGINVYVTLVFGREVYERVANAYIAGLERFSAGGGDPSGVASVASFFISWIDTAIDGIIAERLKTSASAGDQVLLRGLVGKVAIANAKLAYQSYLELCSSARWQALSGRGAQTQRLLWASTSGKNPKYRDVLYVEELIGPDTVNAIPLATFDAFRDHGRPRESLTEDVEGADDTMETLARVGISIKETTEKLVSGGIKSFIEAFDNLLAILDRRDRALGATKINRQSFSLPADLAAQVKTALEDWRVNGKMRRLWARDAALWTGADEADWLGWLGITEAQLEDADHWKRIAEEVRIAGYRHAALLGMGGSSLCPEVIRMTFGKIPGFPELHVLDSTDPAQIKTFESKLDLANTLFIVSSKSGGTLEPNIFKQYFYERVKKIVGEKETGNRFIAITDPGSKLHQVAEGHRFRHVSFGWPSIGGRYSALSNFGLVPAALMGVDVPKFLARTEEMVHACSASVPTDENPGLVLGAILGVAASRFGSDKVTIVTSPRLHDLGAWLEQLLGESTCKAGKGLVPVDRESLGPPEVYGKDRLFAYIRLESGADAEQDAAIAAIERAGHPVVRILMDEIYDLGEEFFRWEIATAVAGSIIGINVFNQPDVEASKVITRRLTTEYEQTGKLRPEDPIFESDGIMLFTDEKNAAALNKVAGREQSLTGYLKAHLCRLRAGDYFAVLGYVEMNEAHEAQLQKIRHAVRNVRRVATCLGFGPRFLHSTGQAYKGGPNSGVFLQITCENALDLPVPGQKYTFGVVKAAQARGDFQVLAERGRRALRVHLGADVEAGLDKVVEAITLALM
ncbi:MAG TPA: bifunctional transaldolase/phosoglucose isomerase [Terriglobia bacterium]|nr:bifunctional transaldolase/phosoglucose isomerase [Terriglobia bacterium]